MNRQRAVRPTRSPACPRASLASAVCLGLVTLSSAATAADFDWDLDGTGDWFDDGNWDPVGEPTDDDEVAIDNGGTAVIDGQAGEAALIHVGDVGSGSLLIDNGGVLDSDNDLEYNFIGRSGGSGEVTVTGQNSTWNTLALSVGSGGDGSLTIEDGGLVTTRLSTSTTSPVRIALAGNGEVTVTGEDSEWDVTGQIAIGVASGSSGTLTIADGGLVSSAQGYLAGGGDILGNSGSQGEAIVTGQDSQWDIGDVLMIGSQGDATVIVADGGLIETGADGVIASQAGSTGEVTVTGANSRWHIDDDLTVGNAGSGTLTITDGGRVETGLDAGGDLEFGGDSAYVVGIDGDGNSGRIVVHGEARLNGATVSVRPEAGEYAEGDAYTIVEADVRDGEFDEELDVEGGPDFAYLDWALDYPDNDVRLMLARNDTGFEEAANTPNQRRIGRALSTLENVDPDAIEDVRNGLVSLSAGDEDAAAAAYDELSGAQHTHHQKLATRAGRQFLGLIAERFVGAPAGTDIDGVALAFNSEGWADRLQLASADATGNGTGAAGESGLWLRGFGGFGEIEGDGNAVGSDYDSVGLALGADTDLNASLMAGAAFGYSHTDADTAGGRLDVDSYQLAGYARWRDDPNYLNVTLGLGRIETESSRSVLGSNARADYGATSFLAALESGRDFALTGGTTFTPFLGLEYYSVDREAFTESGAGNANLAVDDERQNSLQTRLGSRLTLPFETEAGTELESFAQVAWAHELADNEAGIDADFADAAAGTRFRVDGPELDRNRLLIDLGSATRLSGNRHLVARYSGEFAGSHEYHGFSVSYRRQW